MLGSGLEPNGLLIPWSCGYILLCRLVFQVYLLDNAPLLLSTCCSSPILFMPKWISMYMTILSS